LTAPSPTLQGGEESTGQGQLLSKFHPSGWGVEGLTPQSMKNSPDSDQILAKLFGSVSRARILELLLSNSGRTFYQREIMFETGLSLQPTQRELANLLDLGVVKKRETRDRVYYEINTLSPFFKPLYQICESAKKNN
jgi:hypothetical protein